MTAADDQRGADSASAVAVGVGGTVGSIATSVGSADGPGSIDGVGAGDGVGSVDRAGAGDAVGSGDGDTGCDDSGWPAPGAC